MRPVATLVKNTWRHNRRTVLYVALFSLPAWIIRAVLAPRYIYMSFDQARDGFIFEDIKHGHWPVYGPLALAGGYNLPNYYYIIYYALNLTHSADPVMQAAPFVFLSACGVTLSIIMVWQLLAEIAPKIKPGVRLAWLALPLIYVGFAFYDIINMPMIWNPMNLVFWQLCVFLVYMRIRRRQASWSTNEACISWLALGAISAVAASLHGTYLYAIPLWLAGIIGLNLVHKRWISLMAIIGGLLAMVPYAVVDARYGWSNTLAMLRLKPLPGTKPEPLQLNLAHNLWNSWQQFTQKVIFGLSQPSSWWSIGLLCLCLVGLYLMVRRFKALRWYAWWVAVYAVMASLYPGQLPPGIISWHYQQNIQLLPMLSLLCICLSLSLDWQKVKKRLARLAEAVMAGLVIWNGLAFGVTNARLIGRHFHFAYGVNHELITTYEIEQAISRIPAGSRICVPVGFYHPSTYQYIAEKMLHRSSDHYSTDCFMDGSDYMLAPKYYYPFWPPHIQAIPAVNEPYIQPNTTLGNVLYETPQYRIFKIKH